jgi:Ni/Fe-hydrogenase subunit HybB-like protein
MLKAETEDYDRLLNPVYARPGKRFWLAAAALLVVIGWGVASYISQLSSGLGETGMDRPVYWGIYMVNFVFLIGVSMAGTLISAVLQLSQAEWRRPVTRIAEALTVFGLMVAALQLLFDIGHPDRLANIVIYGRLQSPLLWDANSLTLYILASMFALYLQLLPDIALLRDNLPATAQAWQKFLYTRLALGWKGTRTQWARLHKAITVVSVLIIPIGISLHTITSWVFSTTLQPGWTSTILGPYFVVGAIFSGIGMLFIVMTLATKLLNLKDYIRQKHYHLLGWLFIIMSGLWFYFTYTENLTLAAEQESLEFPVLASKLWGDFALSFWGMVILMVIATFIMVVPRLLPSGLQKIFIFKPYFSAASAGTAVVLGIIVLYPQITPFQTAFSAPRITTLGWVVVVFLLLSAGMGISFWLKRHPAVTSVIAGACVVLGMWLERWNIVIPTVTHPRLIPYLNYQPSPVEISLTISSFALLALLFLIFFKLFPAVSVWEVSEGRVIESARLKIEVPAPRPNPTPILQARENRQ